MRHGEIVTGSQRHVKTIVQGSDRIVDYAVSKGLREPAAGAVNVIHALGGLSQPPSESYLASVIAQKTPIDNSIEE